MCTRPHPAPILRALATALAAATPLGAALAADPAGPAAGSVGLSQLAQVLGALALVLVLIFGLALAAQRLRLGRNANGRHLRVIDALALGARERLLLVDVAGERVLLGVAGGRIERLHVLPAGAQTPDATGTPAPAGPFANLLEGALVARSEAP